ncbi:MAG: hypothetical protein QOC93_185 [Actinomycetota bacterium]|jgi:hypothetical protein|nr:hypothetical protein [Actinomycetota bacterium]
MTLTSQLRDPSSPLARLFAAELPDPDAVLRSYRSALPERPATIRPRVPAGEQPPWATIGTAIDLRLRLALTSDPSQDEALPRGVALSARLTDAANSGGPPAVTAADVETAGWALLELLDQLTDAYMPCARSRPVPLSPAAEAQLCRAVYLAAEYVEVYRSGRPGLVLADAGDDGPITLATLLAAVPRYVVDDLTAMVTRADTGLSPVRAAVSSGDVIAGPTFAGSDAVGHADGDWIARGLLVDVKATVHPDRLGELEAYQLAGYALLDWDDRHRIDRVGWYLARQGLLPVWGLDEYLALLGARRTAADLRRIAADVLGRDCTAAPPRPRVTWSDEPTTAAEYLAAHGRREQDRRPPAVAVVARGRAHVRGTVPAWAAPAPADVTTAHRVAVGWYQTEPDRLWEGGFAATLGWLQGAGPAPVSRRPGPADYGTVLAEAGTADAVLYRTSGASVLAAVMCGIEGGEPMTAVHAGGVTVPIPAAVVTDDEWADGALEACMWLLGLTDGCPLLLPVRPAPTLEQRYDALRCDPQHAGTPRAELWTIAAAQAEVNRMATAFADGVPAERRRTVPPMPAGLT